MHCRVQSSPLVIVHEWAVGAMPTLQLLRWGRWGAIMKRRHIRLSGGLALVAALVLAACNPLPAPHSTATPEPATLTPAAGPATTTPTMTAAPTATTRPTATATPLPMPTPTLIPVLQGLAVYWAPGALVQVHYAAGQAVGHAGAYFMSLDTGEVEGWMLAGSHDENVASFSISDDNRWVKASEMGCSWLVDRDTGATLTWTGGSGVWLLAAQGETLIFSDPERVWLMRSGLCEAVTLPLPSDWRQAVISPDGRQAMLLSGHTLYLVDLQTGALRVVSPAERPDGRSVQMRRLDKSSQRTGVVLRTRLDAVAGSTAASEDQVQFFSWQGEEGSATRADLDRVSPDGSLVAWEDDLYGVAPSVVVADAQTLQPRFRVKGATLCYPDIATLGGRWLADSSGVVVLTADGYRIVDLAGNLRAVPAPETVAIQREVLPAPDRADLFVIDRRLVVDANGRRVAEVALSGDPYWTPSHVDPWGQDSTQMRFVLPSPGHGARCMWPWFPSVQVERAPFPAEIAFTVGLPVDDCLSLRPLPDVTARALACVSGGSRLVIAPSAEPIPSVVGAEWADPAAVRQNSQPWVRVRTAEGLEGWVDAEAGNLVWAP
jgi:hypothetical protein